MNFLKYFFPFWISSIFIGCGSQETSDIQSTVHIENKQALPQEINITKAKETIENRAPNVIQIYEAKDKKSLFVYKALPSYEKAYGLYEYDITVYPPVIRNEILSGYRSYIDHLIPLKDGKLIYQTTVFRTRVILYDYIRKKEIREYDVGYIEYGKKIKVSHDENTLYIDKFIFNIQDIYKTYEKGDIEINYKKNELIDHTNNMIWEYSYSQIRDANYTLFDAIKICEEKGSLWHIPSMEEIITVSHVNLGLFKYDIFKPILSKGYWIKPTNLSDTQSFTVEDSGNLRFVLKDVEDKNGIICTKKVSDN